MEYLNKEFGNISSNIVAEKYTTETLMADRQTTTNVQIQCQ